MVIFYANICPLFSAISSIEHVEFARIHKNYGFFL